MLQNKKRNSDVKTQYILDAVSLWAMHHQSDDTASIKEHFYTTKEIQKELSSIVDLEINEITRTLFECGCSLFVDSKGCLKWFIEF